jgi:hypothetical protein
MPGLTSNTQVGIREDLADVISLVDMRQTPFFTMVPKGAEPINPAFSWQMDQYETFNVTGIVDGADVTSFENTARLRARVYGRIQEWRRALMVSIFAEDVSDVAGLGKKAEMAHGILKATTEVKRDIEATLLQHAVDSQADNGFVPNLTRSLGLWLTNNPTFTDSFTIPSAFQTPTTSNVNSSTTSAYGGAYTASSTLVENHLQGLLQSIYLQRGMKNDFKMLCGPTLRRAITNLSVYTANLASNTVARSFYHDEQDSKEIQSTIDLFTGDFGTMEVIPDLFIARDVDAAGTANSLSSGYCIDLDLLSLRWNKRPYFHPLPDQGGGPRGAVIAIGGLEVLNPLGMGTVYATSA